MYNYLRRNKIISKPKLKNSYATLFDYKALEEINHKFLYKNRLSSPKYIIELDNTGIYIATEVNNNPCFFFFYYSTALKFNSESEAMKFIKSIINTSKFSLNIKKLNFEI